MNFLDQAISLLEEYRNTSADGCIGGQSCSCLLCRKYFQFRRDVEQYQADAWQQELEDMPEM